MSHIVESVRRLYAPVAPLFRLIVWAGGFIVFANYVVNGALRHRALVMGPPNTILAWLGLIALTLVGIAELCMPSEGRIGNSIKALLRKSK